MKIEPAYKINGKFFDNINDAVFEKHRHKFELALGSGMGGYIQVDDSIKKHNDDIFKFLIDESNFVKTVISDYQKDMDAK